MYDIKWKNDLKMYMNTFNNFIFEGNINDLQPIDKDGDEAKSEYLLLEEAIAKLYSDDYCVVFFNHTKQSGKVIPETKQAEGGNTSTENVNQEPQIDASWFNSFTFYKTTIISSNHEQISSPNIELFKEYYQKKYLDNIEKTDVKGMQGSRLIDIRRMYDIIHDFEEKRKEDKYKEAKPFMFILPEVSRYMTSPGSPNERELPILMILFNTMQITDTGCKLLMFVDKINDLPPWFESENSNSAVKKIFIPKPDGKMREEFFHQEMMDVMDDSITNSDELSSKIQKFSAYTENYSLQRLMQLKTFIVREEDNRQHGESSYKRIENIDKTVLKFDSGQNKNPWKDKELRERIFKLPAEVQKEIKGQDASIMRVVETLKSAVTGVSRTQKNDRRPRAIFFFAGPTGTGKTEMVKQMAKSIFQKQDSIIRFDMSEFREEHSDARLFGAPPGYVGYEAGGELTRAVKQNPFSIILFDEIEKASPRIWDKFLQILGDGRLTDGKGETVSFTQSIIVFTSNLGITGISINEGNRDKVNQEIIKNNEDIMRHEASIKALPKGDDNRNKEIQALYENYMTLANIKGLTCEIRDAFLFKECYEELQKYDAETAFNDFVKECVTSKIKQYFDNIGRREVLGRIDENNILVFNYISPNVAKKIAEHSIDKFIDYLKYDHDSHLDFVVSEEAKNYILAEVQKPDTLNLGGRGVVTCVEKLLSVPLGDFLFEEDCENISVKLKYEDDILSVSRM